MVHVDAVHADEVKGRDGSTALLSWLLRNASVRARECKLCLYSALWNI